MEPTSSGSQPTIPPSFAVGTGYPTTSTMGGEDYMDRTIVMKVPGSGMTVFNRYKLQRVLGRGGMGVVWLADDLKLERPVALKFLPSLIGLDPTAVKELKTETRRGLELSHPHIVRIYDFVDDEDTAAISMEFVDGKTLSELRLGVEGGVFTVAEVSKWLLGVCDALDYAHFQRKLVHRDLKPANIMLTARDDVAKIADFGIARSLSDTMSRLSVANMGASGTLPYMSPQQAMGERPLPTDDVYSLGATLYELFSGKPPFYRGDLPMQINSKIPPSIAERRGELDITARENLPQLWEQAIAACLSKDPNLRPSSAGTLAEMLGLKPSTATSQSLNFGSTQRIKNPAQSETPKKEPTPLPWIAAAATATFLAGGAAYYFGTQPETTKMPSSAVSFNSSPNSKSSELSKALASNAAKQSDAATTTTHAKPTAEKKPTHEEARSPLATSIDAGAGVSMSTPVAKQDAPMAKQDAPVAKQDAPVAMQDTPTAMHENAPKPSTGTMVAVVTPTQLAQTPPPQASSSQSNASAVGPNSPIAMEPSSTAVPAGVMSMPAAPTFVELPLPAGYTPPPHLREQIFTQPGYVVEPTTGFWTPEQIFPTAPFASYSAEGRRYLIYRAQEVLREKKLYQEAPDGEGSVDIHNAIMVFQAKNSLKANGLLDVPTLAAMSLSTETDNKIWKAPASPPNTKKPVGSLMSPGLTTVPRSIPPKPGSTPRVPVGGRYAPQIKEPGLFERGLNSITNKRERE